MSTVRGRRWSVSTTRRPSPAIRCSQALCSNWGKSGTFRLGNACYDPELLGPLLGNRRQSGGDQGSETSGGVTVQKLVVGSIALLLIALGWGHGSFGEQAPAPRGELRIVDKSPLNWVSITFNVFEHLMELDKDGALVPRLATSWQWLDDRTLEVKLRQGVTFHNGEVFDAEIIKLNWEENTRLRQAHMLGEYLNFTPGSHLEIRDPQTIRFVFPEPDGGALAKLSVMHMGNRQFYREFGWGEASW